MRIGLVNQSSRVKDDDVQTMALAIEAQLISDWAPAWRRAPSSCLFIPGGTKYVQDPDVLALILVDNIDVDGALGYHWEQSGHIYGYIGVGTILDAGGGILTAGTNGDSIASVCSHEALEAKMDPNCNLWVEGPTPELGGKPWAEICFEVCDPCQADSYLKHGVQVSDFVLPSWLDLGNDSGKYSFCNAITMPLSVGLGGYAIVRDRIGSEHSLFRDGINLMPWRRGNRRHVRLT